MRNCAVLALLFVACTVAVSPTAAVPNSNQLYPRSAALRQEQPSLGQVALQGCSLNVRGLRLDGDVKAMFVPEGEADIAHALDSGSAQRLDFELARDDSSNAWLLSTQLPGCDADADSAAPPPRPAVALWCERCVVRGQVLQHQLLASTTDSNADHTASVVVMVLRDGASLLPPGDGGTRSHQGAASRSLLATCQPIVIGGVSHSFSQCLDLTDQVGVPYELQYNLVAAGSGTAFQGGLRVQSGDMWASFAFSPSGGMIGSSAVIATPGTGSSSASVGGYMLETYDEAQVNDSNGTFPLTDAAAGKDADGSLLVVFTAQLDTAPAALAAKPLSALYAIGGLAPSGALRSHIMVGGSYGNLRLTLSAAPATSAVPDPVPATSSPVPETSSPSGLIPVDKPVAIPSPSPSAVAEPSPTPSPASGSPSGSTSSGACSVTVGADTQSYTACLPITGVGSDFVLAWTLDAATNVATMALTATTDGYVAVGFPVDPGQMSGASSVILQACASCTSGASIAQYYMASTNLRDVQPSNQLGATELTASGSNGQVAGRFQVALPPGFPATATPLIFAAGFTTSSGGLTRHVDTGSATVDLSTGGGGDDTIQANSKLAIWNAHAWISTIGWGVLIPISILVAHGFRPHNAWWFAVHRAASTLGFILAMVGFGLGFASGGWQTPYAVHRNMGLAVTILGLVQVTALFLRPKPEAKYRRAWGLYHRWAGRATAILAIANIYYGIINVRKLGTWAWATYTAVLAAILVAAVALDVVNWTTKRRGGGAEDGDEAFISSHAAAEEGGYSNGVGMGIGGKGGANGKSHGASNGYAA